MNDNSHFDAKFGKKVKVLVVDDDRAFLDLMEETLHQQGFEVVIARSGYEAIALLQNKPADLVISDYRMPNGDGVSLSHYCSNHQIACVVFTGSLPEVVRHYLPKGTPVIGKLECFELDGVLGNLAAHLPA